MIDDLVARRSAETVDPSDFNFGDCLIPGFFCSFVMVVFLIVKPLIGLPTTTSPRSAGCRYVSGPVSMGHVRSFDSNASFAAEVQSEVQLSNLGE